MAVATDIVPSIVFLVLYLVYFIILTTLYFQKKINWRSRYSFVYFHVLLRLAASCLGVAFSVYTWNNNFQTKLNVLIANLVLQAEGYFSLVLCAFRFLIVWQEQRVGESNLEPRMPKGTPFFQKWKIYRRSKIMLIHYVLAVANSLIITGGSLLSSALSNTKTPDPNAIQTGKILRVVGTAIFLVLVQVFFAFGIQSYRNRGDRTLGLILLTYPFLTVRGIYGILSIEVWAFSYYNPSVYTSNGMSSTFLAGEYVLCTTMEWISCGLLLATYFQPHESGIDHPEYNENDDNKVEFESVQNNRV